MMHIMKRLLNVLAIFALLGTSQLLPSAADGAQEADRVYVNGNIYTVDRTFSKASAMAVKDGRFLYVGDDAGKAKP
jgi:hypothetical protein